MEALEVDMLHMQEDMGAMEIQSWEDMAAIKESVRKLEKGQERADHYWQKIDIMFNMLFALPQFRLLVDFPPRTSLEPNLDGDGILPRPDERREVEDRLAWERENQVRGIASSVLNDTPMP